MKELVLLGREKCSPPVLPVLLAVVVVAVVVAVVVVVVVCCWVDEKISFGLCGKPCASPDPPAINPCPPTQSTHQRACQACVLVHWHRTLSWDPPPAHCFVSILLRAAKSPPHHSFFATAGLHVAHVI
ncbi:unnamed protein product [Polarella glacialis]|uniref:Uncharacterized protein n=1 Tax=Polarella glacialis TaxID=89957 RepID=A0A813FC04_POLGL|nr:unnamed protein product [Polarella glacialis]